MRPLWSFMSHQYPSRVHGVTLDFWIASIVVTATPGPGALFTIAAALSRGVRVGLVAAAGCTLGIVPHMALALSGAAAVLAASSVAFEVMKWFGVTYLLYLAWGTWRERGVLAPAQDDDQRGASPGRMISGAVLVNLLNPKLTLFFLVFLPIFVDPHAPGALFGMAILGGAFMAVTLAIFAVYGMCAGWLGRYVVGSPVAMMWISRLFALSFLGLAVVLALAQR